MTDNLRIWRQVEKTDPDHTKRVNQRGGFTAIDAHYQIMRATETFGPVGDGWGYDCGEPIFQGDMIIVPVTVWHGTRNTCFGPVYGCAQFLGQRPDADAPKKAMTDALTKALSHLGFNADVFLGKFDDSKYIAALQAEKTAPSADADKGASDWQALSDKMLRAVRNVGAKAWGHPDFKRDLANLKAASPELAAHVEAEIQTKQQAEAA